MSIVKIDFKKLRGNLSKREIVTKTFGKSLGRKVEIEIRRDIAAGKSSVKGVGRFVAYQASRLTSSLRADIRKTKGRSERKTTLRKQIKTEISAVKSQLYPLNVQDEFPRKKERPINLRLEGKYLKQLTNMTINGIVSIGFFSPDELTQAKFETHNLGLHDNVPQRKHLPTERGDKFTLRINRLIKNLYRLRIKAILGKS